MCYCDCTVLTARKVAPCLTQQAHYCKHNIRIDTSPGQLRKYEPNAIEEMEIDYPVETATTSGLAEEGTLAKLNQ